MRQWYQMRAKEADATVAEVLIYDFIGDWIDGMFGFGVTAKSFMDELAALPESTKVIRVHVNSPGGDVFSAVAIANALRDQRVSKGRRVEMVVDGLAASAASLIIMAGDSIQMADNGLVMVHDAWTVKQGNAKDLRAEADRLDQLRDAAIVPTYQWHVKLSAPAILELMAKETWMNADEAIALGFATEKVEGLRAAAALDPSQPITLAADPRHAEALAALLALPPKKKEEPKPEEAPAPAEETPAPAPAEETPAPAPAGEETPAPAPEAPAAEPEKKAPADLLDESKEHLKEIKTIAEGLADGSLAPDDKAFEALMEHVTLLEEALDTMPPLPKSIKEEEAPKPKKEEAPAEAPPAPAEEPKALEIPVTQARAEAPAPEPVLEAEVVPTVAAAEVLRRCVENKLSLAFAAPLSAASLTEEELTLRISSEVSRLAAEATRVDAVRSMFKKANLETLGDLVADAGVGVASAGRIVTELKALKDSVEIDGHLSPTAGQVRKVLSYREAMDRVNNPTKEK